MKHLEINESLEQYTQNGTVIVDFYADWCGPCKMLAPYLEQLNAQYPELTIVKVNVDEHSDIAQSFGIRSIPTLIGFKDGQMTQRHSGLMSISDMEKTFGLAQTATE